MVSAQACGSPPVVAPRLVGEFMLMHRPRAAAARRSCARARRRGTHLPESPACSIETQNRVCATRLMSDLIVAHGRPWVQGGGLDWKNPPYRKNKRDCRWLVEESQYTAMPPRSGSPPIRLRKSNGCSSPPRSRLTPTSCHEPGTMLAAENVLLCTKAPTP